ncbi:hypothetical protein [Corynebacterium pseudopelargi]|uniref:hypothetical protein n=1 Tax=Corynebacterium pseudopelargi TaxID=2080757 RepID=UPI000F5043FA|nr:hypothetical protein [Corynebacterium pseudopelargi]
MHFNTRSLGGASAALLVASPVLIACSSQEPSAVEPDTATRQIRVGIDHSNPTQAMLAELYAQALNRKGRATELVALDRAGEGSVGKPWDLVSQSRLDLVAACTGSVLLAQDSPLAHELSDDLAAAKKQDFSPAVQQEWRDTTYEAMVGTLAGDVDAADPSRASACAAEDSLDLPKSIVPVYRADVISRQQRVGLNWVSGALDDATLSSLVTQANKGDRGEVAAGFLDEVGLH